VRVVVIALALLQGGSALASKGHLFVETGVRCPSSAQLLEVLRTRLPDRSIQLAKGKTARPLLQVTLGSPDVLRVSLIFSRGRTVRRDLQLSPGQCSATAETIGFLVKSWLEQVPLLSPEAPLPDKVEAIAPSAAERAKSTGGAGGVNGTAKPGTATVGETVSGVPPDLELPIAPGTSPPAPEPIPPPPPEPAASAVVVVVAEKPKAAPATEALGFSLSVLLAADASISGTGDYASFGLDPAVRFHLDPHWSLTLVARFSTASSETIAEPPSTIRLQRTSFALWGGYEFLPHSRWGLEVFVGPDLQYWSTSSSGDYQSITPQSATLWQGAVDGVLQVSWRPSPHWTPFLYLQIQWFFQTVALTVDTVSGGAVSSVDITTSPIWGSLGLGLAYDFF
jgi:hypothetical protein